MGKKKLMLHSAAFLAIAVFGFLGIGSTASSQKSVVGEEVVVSSKTTSKGRVNNMIDPHEKSYETLGLVFATSVTEFDEQGHETSSQEGIVTMLLREAHKMGADDILNLRIDENTVLIRTTSKTSTSTDSTTRTSSRRKVTYTGSALAIKYNDNTVPPSNNPLGNFVPGKATIEGKFE